MGDVEREFIIGTILLRADLDCPVNVNDQVAGNAFFARDGVIAEADDIRRAVFLKVVPVGLGDASVVGQNNADFAPDFRGCFGFYGPAQPIS